MRRTARRHTRRARAVGQPPSPREHSPDDLADGEALVHCRGSDVTSCASIATRREARVPQDLIVETERELEAAAAEIAHEHRTFTGGSAARTPCREPRFSCPSRAGRCSARGAEPVDEVSPLGVRSARRHGDHTVRSAASAPPEHAAVRRWTAGRREIPENRHRRARLQHLALAEDSAHASLIVDVDDQDVKGGAPEIDDAMRIALADRLTDTSVTSCERTLNS